MTDLRKLLDDLDAAREKATPQPWAEWDSAVVNPATPARDVFVECDYAPDAALIVAAVNALPRLTAALRAVDALTIELDWDAVTEREIAEKLPDHDMCAQAYDDAARRIRVVLAAALDPA